METLGVNQAVIVNILESIELIKSESGVDSFLFKDDMGLGLLTLRKTKVIIIKKFQFKKLI